MMTSPRAVPALISVMMFGLLAAGAACTPEADDGGGAGGSGTAGSGGGGGTPATGGRGSGGTSATGGSGGAAAAGGSGGASGGAGGRGGGGGTSATGGSGGSTGGGGASGSGGRGPDAAPETGGSAGWPDCLEPVFSGVTPAEFCMVYGNVCGFTGMNHYTSAADCMSKFRGGSNDGDACKSGHLCRAATMPAMKEMDCRTAGTAQCRNN